MTNPANKIAEFESLLTTVAEGYLPVAYRLANDSLDKALVYLRMCYRLTECDNNTRVLRMMVRLIGRGARKL